MVTVTLSVPIELKKRMEQFPEINWSEVARQAFMEKIEDLLFLQEFKSKSGMTMKEALEMGAETDGSLSRKYKRR
jgi:hypothetical protein